MSLRAFGEAVSRYEGIASPAVLRSAQGSALASAAIFCADLKYSSASPAGTAREAGGFP
jgi:hypothetical protein